MPRTIEVGHLMNHPSVQSALGAGEMESLTRDGHVDRNAGCWTSIFRFYQCSRNQMPSVFRLKGMCIFAVAHRLPCEPSPSVREHQVIGTYSHIVSVTEVVLRRLNGAGKFRSQQKISRDVRPFLGLQGVEPEYRYRQRRRFGSPRTMHGRQPCLYLFTRMYDFTFSHRVNGQHMLRAFEEQTLTNGTTLVIKQSDVCYTIMEVCPIYFKSCRAV